MTKGYEQRKEANKRYLAKLGSHMLRMPARQKSHIKSAAAAAGQSVNAYILQAVAERMQRDGFQPSDTVQQSEDD